MSQRHNQPSAGDALSTTYQFGIEEEYFLADATTRGRPWRTVKAFHDAARTRLPRVERELLQSQVEVSAPPSASLAEAREVLAGLRAGLAEVGQAHGILVLAAGTHPIARWARQSNTQKDRYEKLMRELRTLDRRNVVCGMHVHVEVPRPKARVDLMNRLPPSCQGARSLGWFPQPGHSASRSRPDLAA